MFLKNLQEFKKLATLIPILTYQKINNEIILVVSNKHLFFVSKFLKQHIGLQYNLLSCISGVDLLNKLYRFSVVYELLSPTYNARLRLKVFLTDETVFVRSIVDLFINANWWEREIWDLFGIYFEKHPDLRRILTDYGFEGYPMRKDFPLSGFVEVRYDETKKRVVLEPIELAQEFRLFTFETPW